MIRYSLLTVALVILVSGSNIRGQDSDEVKRLKERNELLETKLKLANSQIENLKNEIKDLKAQKPGEKEGGKKSLSDLLPEGKIIAGDFAFTKGSNASGTITLTIKERKGNKVKCTSVIVENVKDSQPKERDLEGDIDGVLLSVRTVGTSVKMTMKVEMKGDSLSGTFLHANGAGGNVGFKLPK